MSLIGSLKSKRAQSMVETALIMPVIILALTGIIDFGLAFNNYFIINNASREAARNAAVGSSDSEVHTVVANVTSSLEADKLQVTIYPAESLRKKGDEVSVTIEYDNSLMTPVISAIVTNPMHLTSKTVMRIE